MEKRLPKFKRVPEQLPNRKITTRSLQIIALLEHYRLAPTSIIVKLLGGNERITARHLQSLYHKGLINRFTIEKIKGYPGEFVYLLDNPVALELLMDYFNAPKEKLDFDLIKRNKEKDYPSIYQNIDERQGQLLTIKHELMITRFHAILEMACRKSNGKVDLIHWKQDPSIWDRVEVPKLITEKHRNEFIYKETSDKEWLPVRPDALFMLEFQEQNKQVGFCYEADRMTTTNTNRFNLKLRAYFHYIVKQKKHLEKWGIDRIKAVLTETINNEWADTLRQSASRPLVSGKPSPLFWFTSSSFFTEPQEIKIYNKPKTIPLFYQKPEVVFKKIWGLPDSDAPKSLLED